MRVLKQKILKAGWSPSMSWCMGSELLDQNQCLNHVHTTSSAWLRQHKDTQEELAGSWEKPAQTSAGRQALGGQENRVPRILCSARVGQIPANRSSALQGWMMVRTSHGRCWSGSTSASASASWRPTRTTCPRCRRWRSSSWARNRWVPSALPWGMGRAAQLGRSPLQTGPQMAKGRNCQSHSL